MQGVPKYLLPLQKYIAKLACRQAQGISNETTGLVFGITRFIRKNRMGKFKRAWIL